MNDTVPHHLAVASAAVVAALVVLLAGCAEISPRRVARPLERLQAELSAAAAAAAPAAASASTPAPTTPAAAAPARPEAPPEPRFDLVVNGAQARDVFLSLVADTRYSMLMHPEVAGTISVTLRGVTVREALESIRDVYGYDYRVDGRRVTVYPPTMQTRIFTISYLHASRQGQSEVRVSSSSAPASNNGSAAAPPGTPAPANAGGSPLQAVSSRIVTSTHSDYWGETVEALRALLGKGEGRQVIASPQAGTVAVRAMPDELRQVEAFLRASRAAIERQVMLEAKIVEVELREGFQSGIDWSVLKKHGAIGQTSGVPGNPLLGNANGLPTLPQSASALVVDAIGLPSGVGGALGLSLAARGFQAVLGFLETQGDTQVLSSPRLATLNNQKAVLKVGVDDYFVTNVSGGSITPASGNASSTTTLPSLTLTPFFSGVALDVTPQIDDGGMITLHLRPSVSTVTERAKQIDLGTIGNYRLPLASSSVNETDTIVRVADGYIVAIGGLMQSESSRTRSGLPGSADHALTRSLLGNSDHSGRKKELVILLKPTIVRGADEWQRTTEQALAALDERPEAVRRVITLDGAGAVSPPVVKAR